MSIQNGRKSAASLAVVPFTPGALPEPPDTLTPAQKAVWRAITATKPSTWFTQDTFPLLTAYCRHATAMDTLSSAIDQITDLSDPEQRALYDGYLKIRANEGKSLLSLATAMRLTQHSSVRADAAMSATARAKTTGTSKPWASE